MRPDNAIIMAAGTSSRFAPLSYEKHKALTEVKGEILIERQIKQLKDSGIDEIYIITGYKSEQFYYLREKLGVKLLHNPDYMIRNNNSSIWAARNILRNSYVCSADNYFTLNPFEREINGSYYAAVYSEGSTSEWCMTEDEDGYINSVRIGGKNSWYMLGHAFWSEDFSRKFLSILENEYNKPETVGKLWEKIFAEHLDVLKMKIKKYSSGIIFEFDSLDELRKFDLSYINDTRSSYIKRAALLLGAKEAEIVDILPLKSSGNEAEGFKFFCKDRNFCYIYDTGIITRA